MPSSSTMTIRISDDLKRQLTRLSHETRRSNSFLAGEALAAYVAQELAIIDGIQRGMDDVTTGRTVPHDAAMDELDAIIAAAG
jgi:predicted transcriptional regulator